MVQRKNNNKNLIERFNSGGSGGGIFALIWYGICLFAIFLFFKCNDMKDGFKWLEFLFAICCGPLYMCYKLGTAMNVCFPKNK